MFKKVFTKMVSFITAVIMTVSTAAVTASSAHGSDAAENDFAAMAKEIAILVNKARVEQGLNEVYVLPYLCDVAQLRAEESSASFSHTRTNGSSFSTAIDTELVPFSFSAENLAAGSSTAIDTFNQWKSSPGHWANILNPEITHMGIGVVYEEGSEYGYYWQQTFVKTDMEFADEYIPTEHEIVPQAEGDVTGDKVINAYDYLLLTEYLSKKKTHTPVYMNPAQLESADCFQDGLITESDAKVMVRYLLGEYKALPYVFF